MTTCTDCSASWSGMRAAHCAGCHQTFATVADFDYHRSGRRSAPCDAPAAIGLAPNAHGYWGIPNPEEDTTT
ncbi:hypothetical protein Afil01_62330 [Actinorhabdospora filicis]|uniref:Phage FDXHR zinc binding domain-containing protein n=1 Tax=Actinorhabdospora filicis TaxID=1785913 RepID=A0A9W6WDB0_9ACTN|nr:hypothetical protein [Actinorhabdospora filicis]GLZ81426.1 hypothetical protein Afil01_62330 [Actinorhabdospora filicis]